MTKKQQPKVSAAATVRVNAYAIVARAVEEGVAIGYRRAHKHVDKPSEEHLRESIETEVMNALCEYLYFEPIPND